MEKNKCIPLECDEKNRPELVLDENVEKKTSIPREDTFTSPYA